VLILCTAYEVPNAILSAAGLFVQVYTQQVPAHSVCTNCWEFTDHIHRYPTSVSAMSFNLEGNLLAVASSYAYEEVGCGAQFAHAGHI
jgi:hypothetical protein